jgi:hypothetical protein
VIAFLYRQLNSEYEEDRSLKVILGAEIKEQINESRSSQRCPPLLIQMPERSSIR